MFQLKSIFALFLIESVINQAVIIQSNPNQEEQLSQAQLAQYYQQAQQGNRDFGRDLYQPQVISAADYMSGKVQLPKEVLQNFQIQGGNTGSNSQQIDPETLQVKMQQAFNQYQQSNTDKYMNVVDRLRQQERDKILQQQQEQQYKQQKEKNIQAGFWSAKYALPVDTNYQTLNPLINRTKDQQKPPQFNPQTEDDVKKYYRLQYNNVFKIVLPIIYQQNQKPQTQVASKPTPLVQYNSQAFSDNSIARSQSQEPRSSIPDNRQFDINTGRTIQKIPQGSEAQNDDLKDQSVLNNKDTMGGPSNSFTSGGSPSKSDQTGKSQFTEQVQKIRQQQEWQQLKNQILSTPSYSSNPFNQFKITIYQAFKDS